MKEKTTTTASENEETLIITSSGGKCIGGHSWTYGGRDINLEGQICDCGMVIYEKPKYCDKCGQTIKSLS